MALMKAFVLLIHGNFPKEIKIPISDFDDSNGCLKKQKAQQIKLK